jgi:HemY protein
MIRVLVYLVILAALAYGGMLLVENPGHVTMTWHGEVLDAPAALLVAAVAVAAILVWSVLRFVVGLPSFLKFTARQRRREKGYAALSRGLIAVGAGDARTAGKAASQANRHLRNDPLAIMLRAQAAHLNGESRTAHAAFEELAQRDDTRILGLRGLHAEATRRGDEDAARHFAAAAHRASPLPWSAQAVLEHRASDGDWEKALATVETSLAARLIDKSTGDRQRAVLETAIAYDKEAVAPDAALALARMAMRRAPDLAPAIVLAARLLTRKGDIRKAAKLIEKAWPRCQHPDIAQAYLDVRPGDSTQDRLARAKSLLAISSFDPVSRTTVARAALANKDFATARDAMAPLIAEGKRPTVRQCALMAELEEAQFGDTGLWREWLARAARAPLDPAWIADGIVYDQWAPASPTTGRLDAFSWQVPAERLGPAMEATPMSLRGATSRTEEKSLAAAPAAPLIRHDSAPAHADTDIEPEVHASPNVPPEPPEPAPKAEPQRPVLTAEPRNSDKPAALFHRRRVDVADAGASTSNGAAPLPDIAAEAVSAPILPAPEASLDQPSPH